MIAFQIEQISVRLRVFTERFAAESILTEPGSVVIQFKCAIMSMIDSSHAEIETSRL